MNIYCFSTLSFAKLQFKSVINKAFHKHGVASFTDAWIETVRCMSCIIALMSHLLQMRGLKLNGIAVEIPVTTSHLLQMRGLKHCGTAINDRLFESHLLQMRGLKPLLEQLRKKFEESHLLQMRGLKLNIKMPEKYVEYVASFTDAWIETRVCAKELYRKTKSHLLQMRGLKHIDSGLDVPPECRIFYRCVD